MISISSKRSSLFQAFCSSSIRKRCIRSSLCDEASFLTRMRACTRSRGPLVLLSFCGHCALVKAFVFQIQIKRECLRLSFTCEPRCSGLPPNVPGSLVIPALGALLRSVSSHALALLCNALNRWLGRWYFTYQCSAPGAVDRADYISLSSRLSWGSLSGYLQFQASLPRLLL